MFIFQTSPNIVNEFEFIKSDDVPLNYNAIFGGSELQYSNGYLYFHNNGFRNKINFPENKTLCRYNIETNNLTLLNIIIRI